MGVTVCWHRQVVTTLQGKDDGLLNTFRFKYYLCRSVARPAESKFLPTIVLSRWLPHNTTSTGQYKSMNHTYMDLKIKCARPLSDKWKSAYNAPRKKCHRCALFYHVNTDVPHSSNPNNIHLQGTGKWALKRDPTDTPTDASSTGWYLGVSPAFAVSEVDVSGDVLCMQSSHTCI